MEEYLKVSLEEFQHELLKAFLKNFKGVLQKSLNEPVNELLQKSQEKFLFELLDVILQENVKMFHPERQFQESIISRERTITEENFSEGICVRINEAIFEGISSKSPEEFLNPGKFLNGVVPKTNS